MPTIITHAVVGLVSAKLLPKQEIRHRLSLASVVCAVLPDADVIAFSFGIPYDHFFGHRGVFHSVLFALLLSVVVTLCVFSELRLFSKTWWSVIAFLFVVTASHGILDAITDGGLGIALLSPFDTTRYFFPWRPLLVSPIGLSAFISEWGLRVLICEIIYVWLPLSVILMTCHITGYLYRFFNKSG
jgi:inner membrane protein